MLSHAIAEESGVHPRTEVPKWVKLEKREACFHAQASSRRRKGTHSCLPTSPVLQAFDTRRSMAASIFPSPVRNKCPKPKLATDLGCRAMAQSVRSLLQPCTHRSTNLSQWVDLLLLPVLSTTSRSSEVSPRIFSCARTSSSSSDGQYWAYSSRQGRCVLA